MRPWLDPLFEAAEMRAVDGWAIEEAGVPSLDLMERAGVGLARLTAAVSGPGPVRWWWARANNGGDGLVAARLLRRRAERWRFWRSRHWTSWRGRRVTGAPAGRRPGPFDAARLADSE